MKRLLNWDNVTIEHIALADKEAETTLFIPTNSVSKNRRRALPLLIMASGMISGLQKMFPPIQ
jgi:hypothetical protein